MLLAFTTALLIAARADDVVVSKSVVRIELGEARERDTANHFALHDLALDGCIVRPTAAGGPVPRGQITTDSLVLDVLIRHHRTREVVVSQIDPGFAWIEPCVEREVFSHRWPIRDGRVELPLTFIRPVEGPAPIGLVPPPPPPR